MMNITPAPYCKHCQFYHGANSVVCGLHPYGPDSETCSDYVSKVSSLNQGKISRDSWSIRQFHNWKGWQKLLMLGLLLGTVGSFCVLSWLATHPTNRATKTTTKSGLVR